MDRQLSSLLDGFIDSLLDGDHPPAVARYDLPITFIRPNETLVFEDRESFLRTLENLWSHYRRAGTVGLRRKLLHRRDYGPDLVVADIQWTFVDRNGEDIRTIFSTYVLRRTDDGYRVLTHISHNEILQRPLN